MATSRAGVSHRFVHNRCGQPASRSNRNAISLVKYCLCAIVFESGCSLGCHGEWTAELHRADGGGRACRAPRRRRRAGDIRRHARVGAAGGAGRRAAQLPHEPRNASGACGRQGAGDLPQQVHRGRARPRRRPGRRPSTWSSGPASTRSPTGAAAWPAVWSADAGSGCSRSIIRLPRTGSAARSRTPGSPCRTGSRSCRPTWPPDALPGLLAAAGFDGSAPALVSWLGVTMYLTGDAIAATLAALGAPRAGQRGHRRLHAARGAARRRGRRLRQPRRPGVRRARRAVAVVPRAG